MAARSCGRIFSSSNRNFSVYFQRCATNTRLRRYSTSMVVGQKLKSLVNEAEKVVGYPTSLIRYLLTDEISSALVQSKKLVGSRHPLVKTARSLVYDGVEGFKAIGLVVLLMSRAGESLITSCPPLGHEAVSGVLRNQRKLAEVAETINAGYMVHLGVINKRKFLPSDDEKVMHFGNKISILSGDFLLAKASVGLAELENTKVVEVMAEVIGDIVEGETIKDYCKLESLKWENWEDIVFKSKGSLFAKSCMSVLKLGPLPEMHQEAAFTFGKYLAFLQQLHSDYKEITSDCESTSVTNAAVILAKDNLQPNLTQNELEDSFIVVNDRTRFLIEESDSYTKMQDFCNTYGDIALKSLEPFPRSEAKNCLEDLIKHLQVLGNSDG